MSGALAHLLLKKAENSKMSKYIRGKIKNCVEIFGLVNKKENREDIWDIHTFCQNRGVGKNIICLNTGYKWEIIKC